MENRKKEEGARCLVCNAPTERGRKLCDCCRESFALCDLENYIARKAARKIYGAGGANAFK